SPKKTTKRNSGSHVTTAPFEWKLINPSRWPSWKIQTSTTYDAATESRFNRIALIGTTIERNVSSNSRKASPSTNANTIGKRCFTVVLKSREPAVSPDTAYSAPENWPIVAGNTFVRSV